MWKACYNKFHYSYPGCGRPFQIYFQIKWFPEERWIQVFSKVGFNHAGIWNEWALLGKRGFNIPPLTGAGASPRSFSNLGCFLLFCPHSSALFQGRDFSPHLKKTFKLHKLMRLEHARDNACIQYSIHSPHETAGLHTVPLGLPSKLAPVWLLYS